MDSFNQDGCDAARSFVVKGAPLRFPLRLLWKYPCESLADWQEAPATKYSKKKVRSGPLLLSPDPAFIDGGRVVFTDGGIYGAPYSSADAPATFHCVNAATGERLWRRLHDLPGFLEIEGVAAGSMIVHRWWEESPSLRAFSLEDGREVWSLAGRTLSSNLLVVGEDIVTALTSPAQGPPVLTRIDGKSGALRWHAPLEGEEFAIAADHSAVYLTEAKTDSLTLRAACYSLTSGVRQWAVELDGHAAPLDRVLSRCLSTDGKSLPRVSQTGVADGRQYVSFERTAVACLDAASGQLLWAFADFEIGFLVSTILMNDAICTTSSLGQGEHTYCRINPHTGDALLKRMLPLAKGSLLPLACASGNAILFPRGELCAIAADTGETVWRSEAGVLFRTEDGEDVIDSFSAPRIAGGRVYAARSGTCCLYCFGYQP